MAVRHAFVFAMCVAFVSSASAQSPSHQRLGTAGAIAGQVVDASGVPQAGIPVRIHRQDGPASQTTVVTAPNGRFSMPRLKPGMYAVEVAIPNFFPFLKSPVSVKAGAEILLDINLRSLAQSMQIGLPPLSGSDASNASERGHDDWTWALRSASAVRPVLRFRDDTGATKIQRASFGDHPLRGTVTFSAGNQPGGFGANPGLHTVFDVVYEQGPSSTLDMAGSAGWDRGTPAAAFRTAWNHRSDDGTKSSLSATLRQLFLPSSYRNEIATPDFLFGRQLQSFSGAYLVERPLSNHTVLRYGAAYDTVLLRDAVGHMSPFAEVSYAPDARTQVNLTYSGQAPRQLPNGPAGTTQLEQALAIPQMSTSVGDMQRTVLEKGKHAEAAVRRSIGNRLQVHAATFYDSLTDVAVSAAGDNEAVLIRGLLHDPFSDSHFLDGGKYSSVGARASASINLRPSTVVVAGYSYSGGISFENGYPNLTAQSPAELQAMLRKHPQQSFVIKASSTLPQTHTRVTTSYRWLPRNAAVAGDPYDKSAAHSDPYLNVAVVQPLPSPEILAGQFQAVAEFSNLLAQGYIVAHGTDGLNSYLFPATRSFRGGFSFVF